MTWKWFRHKDSKDAVLHAIKGGISIHEDINKQGTKEHAILIAADTSKLIEAAKEIGLQPRWMIKDTRPHFELKGEPLREAKRRCNQNN
jgi:hypothetical protein